MKVMSRYLSFCAKRLSRAMNDMSYILQGYGNHKGVLLIKDVAPQVQCSIKPSYKLVQTHLSKNNVFLLSLLTLLPEGLAP
jgi:hypothetical protein